MVVDAGRGRESVREKNIREIKFNSLLLGEMRWYKECRGYSDVNSSESISYGSDDF